MNTVNMNWNRRPPINMRRVEMNFAMIGWGPICDLLLMNEQFMHGQIIELRVIM